MKQEEKDLIYIATCALHGTDPDPTRLIGMDWEAVYARAVHHRMTSIIAFGLEPVADLLPPEVWKRWKKDEDKMVQRSMLFDMERTRLLNLLEERHIWYVSLKGIIIKDMYPRYGMREMSDNDFLVDGAGIETVHELMKNEGYYFKEHEERQFAVHDAFIKKPIYNFEFHWKLFSSKIFRGKGVEYFDNVKDRLIKKPGKDYEYYMTPEDCYIYVTAHAARHYEEKGTGLRTLADEYVYLKHEFPTLGPEGGTDEKGKECERYLQTELDKLGLKDFERVLRKLALRVFSGEEEIYDMQFSEEEETMLSRLLIAGADGDMGVLMDNRMQEFIKDSGSGPFKKFRYAFRRLFPTMEYMKKQDEYRKILEKRPYLLPAMQLRRLFLGMTKKRKKVGQELRYLKKWKK